MHAETNWRTLDKKHIWHPCAQMKDYETLPPLLIERAEGSYLYDEKGKRYLDIISSWWCNLLGHNSPRLTKALQKQAAEMSHIIFANFTHKPAIELCARLAKLLPSGLSKFFFTDNGSSAIEAAMKMSFQYHQQQGQPQRTRFMALSDAYHGETLGALSTGGVSLYSEMYQPLLLDVIRVPAPDCYRCPYGQKRDTCSAPCFEKAEEIIESEGAEVAAFLVEPLLQGAAGMRIYPPLYLKKLREATARAGIHLIADEIATGFGRTGSLFACKQAEISPDIMCLSKGLTGGTLPMALCVTTEEIFQAFYADYNEGKAFLHSHTYSGNPLACAVALAVLDTLEEENILEKSRTVAQFLTEELQKELGHHPHIGEIRSLHLVHALELVEEKDNQKPFDSHRRLGYEIYKKALAKGLILRPLGDVLYFNPPLTLSLEEAKEAVALCKEALLEVLPT